jgi:hypothetical protein
MRTKKYKTLKGLISQNGGQFSFNDFHANRMFHKDLGWITFRLPDSEKDKGYKLLAGTIYSNAEKMYTRLKFYRGRDYGIFRRIFFEKNGERATYCAGQDYDSEVRFIQKLLRD